MTPEQIKLELEKLAVGWRTKVRNIEDKYTSQSPREVQIATQGIVTCAEEIEDLIKEIK